MQDQITLAIITAGSTLLGAAIGTFASLGASWVRESHESKRRTQGLLVQVATDDWKTQFDQAKQSGKLIMPLSSFVAYHAALSELFLKGHFDAQDTKEVIGKANEIVKQFFEASKSAESYYTSKNK